MLRRIAAVVCGLALVVVGAPASPASAAAGVTCANITDYWGTQEPIIIARTCIAWDELPADNRWTLHQSKIWNPPVAPNIMVYANFYFNNSGERVNLVDVANNQTVIRWANTVGPYTAKFEVYAPAISSVSYCMYMLPRTYTQVHRPCS